MLCLKVLIISLLFVIRRVELTEVTRFDNYKVYKLHLNSWEDVEFADDLEKNDYSIEVLSAILKKVPQQTNILVPPHRSVDFESLLNAKSIEYNLIEDNFQDVIDQDARINHERIYKEEYGWERYYKLKPTYKWMKVLEAKYPGVVTTVVSGQSYEERDVMGIKISYGADHPAIFIESGMHAREWISPATATYIANELLTSEDPEVRRIAESYDWYIFPITNPDGYEYTWQVNRLWRKTRKPCGLCYGADPNRNWDFHWREAGTSSYPCSEVYAGKKAFSESETKSLADFISTISGLKLYVSIHSYSQLLLYPFGVKSVTLSNTEDYDTISNATVEAIAQRYGTKYIYGNIVDTIYPAAGASICWVNGVLNVPLTFAFELRPDSESEYGFLLPPDQIIPTGEETLDGFVAMIQTSESLGYMTL